MIVNKRTVEFFISFLADFVTKLYFGKLFTIELNEIPQGSVMGLLMGQCNFHILCFAC